MHKEKRNSKRVTFLCEVSCTGEGGNRLNTRITDLSRTGAFIDSMTQFNVGSILTLWFQVGSATVQIKGEVRYVMPQVGMGVQFLDLTPNQMEAIESLVEGRPLAPEIAMTQHTEQTVDRQPAAERIPHGQNVLSGNFAVLSLFDIIQMIENTRLTGALRITLPSESGEIYFNDGHIVGAKAGTASGLDALNRFLGATEGTFEFKKSSVEYEQHIFGTSNTALILDLLRTRMRRTSIRVRNRTRNKGSFSRVVRCVSSASHGIG